MDYQIVMWTLIVIGGGTMVAASLSLWLSEVQQIGQVVGWPVLAAWVAAAVSVPGILIGHTLATLG